MVATDLFSTSISNQSLASHTDVITTLHSYLCQGHRWHCILQIKQDTVKVQFLLIWGISYKYWYTI